MMYKLHKHILKMTPEVFKKFIEIDKILNWKEGYIFLTNANRQIGILEHEWKHVDGSGSGEVFDTKEECELSALIHFCGRQI